LAQFPETGLSQFVTADSVIVDRQANYGLAATEYRYDFYRAGQHDAAVTAERILCTASHAAHQSCGAATMRRMALIGLYEHRSSRGRRVPLRAEVVYRGAGAGLSL
jgi:hypothetical protein